MAAAGLRGIRLAYPFPSSLLPSHAAERGAQQAMQQQPVAVAPGSQQQADQVMEIVDIGPQVEGLQCTGGVRPGPVQVEVAPGLRFSCPHPEAAAAAAGAASAAGLQLEQRGLQLELLLARLLRSCAGQPGGSCVAGLLQGASVVQVRMQQPAAAYDSDSASVCCG